MDLAVNPASPQAHSLTFLYKMPIDVSENEWDDEVTEYAVHKVKLTPDQLVCPLCDILGRLISREMLEAHLKWDHRDVGTSWRKRKNGVSSILYVKRCCLLISTELGTCVGTSWRRSAG
jgi:hypothetical protein